MIIFCVLRGVIRCVRLEGKSGSSVNKRTFIVKLPPRAAAPAQLSEPLVVEGWVRLGSHTSSVIPVNGVV